MNWWKWLIIVIQKRLKFHYHHFCILKVETMNSFFVKWKFVKWCWSSFQINVIFVRFIFPYWGMEFLLVVLYGFSVYLEFLSLWRMKETMPIEIFELLRKNFANNEKFLPSLVSWISINLMVVLLIIKF